MSSLIPASLSYDGTEYDIIEANASDRQWGGDWTFCSLNSNGEVVGIPDTTDQRVTLKQAVANASVPSYHRGNSADKSRGLYYKGQRVAGVVQFYPEPRSVTCRCYTEDGDCICGARQQAINEGIEDPVRNIFGEYDLPDGPPLWFLHRHTTPRLGNAIIAVVQKSAQ